jgi:general L-amino acid transport system substrate-binding protein
MMDKGSCCRTLSIRLRPSSLMAAPICVQSQTTTLLNYFRANNMKFEEKRFSSVEEMFKAYASGK